MAPWIARLSITALGAALIVWALSADAHWADRHVLALYCATNVVESILSGAARWIGGALGVAAIWKIAPAVARRVESAGPRVRAGPLLGVAIAVAASLAVAELYMRRQHDRLARGAPPPAGSSDVAMTRVDPRLGWSYIPGRTTTTEVAGRRVAYAIDADGDRAASPGDLPDPARPTVLFAGESIAFGYGLPYEESIPFLVGRDLGVQVVNLAVVGYGNDQAHLRVVEALPRLARPLAAVTVFVTSQMKRNVEPWRARLALAPGGALVAVPPAGGPRIARLLGELPYRGDEALRVTASILRATAEAARARGAFPLFVVTNYGPACLPGEQGEPPPSETGSKTAFRGGDEPWIVDELFVRQGLAFVRVDLGPEDLLPGLLERHPSLRGTRKIAAAVVRALSQGLGATPVEAAVERRSP